MLTPNAIANRALSAPRKSQTHNNLVFVFIPGPTCTSMTVNGCRIDLGATFWPVVRVFGLHTLPYPSRFGGRCRRTGGLLDPQ